MKFTCLMQNWPADPDALLDIVAGDDHAEADGRALAWTNPAGNWPDLSAADITFTADQKRGSGSITLAGVVAVGSGAGQRVYVEVAHDDTTGQTGLFTYSLTAELAGGNIVTLADGGLILRPEVVL